MSTETEAVTTPEPTEPATAPEGGANGEAGGPTAAAPAELPNVYQAIAAAIREMPAIEKGDEAPREMGGYKFRGVERIMAAAQKILAKHGVVFYGEQRLIGIDYDPRGWGNTDRMHRVMTETTWTIRGPRGDRVKPAPITQAMALDSTDKGLNKCATQAKKYMLMDLLQIADASSDTDGQIPDPGPERQPEAERDPNPKINAEKGQEIAGRIKALPETQRAELAATWKQVDPMDGKPYLPLDDDGKPAVRLLRANDVPAVEAVILRLEKAAKAAATPTSRAQALAEKARTAAAAEKVTDTDAYKAAGGPQPDAAEAAQDAPGEPAAAAGGEPAAETAEGDTEAVDEPGCWVPAELGDLTDWSNTQLSDLLRGIARHVGQDDALADTVEALHHTKVNAEIRSVEGQTVGDDEDIDHRKMRVYLGRLMVRLGDDELDEIIERFAPPAE